MTRADRRAAAGALALAGLLLGARGPGDDRPAAWTQRKAITLPALAARGLVEVPLDAQVYRDAQPTFGDLRIRDGSGGEVGYALRRHERPATRRERELPLVDLGEVPPREVRFVLDLGPGATLHNGVRIRIGEDARNFRVPVRVETSPDRRAWQLVRAAGFIYVMEGETRAADTSVSYPTSTARYVRVTISRPPGPAFSVRGASVIVETRAERAEEAVPATLVERVEDAKARGTRLTLDLGGRRPVDRADLEVADRTFHRVVVVEASDDRQRWRWVGSGALSAVETPRVRERQTRLEFPETPARYLRLTIQNLDDRPLQVGAVRLAGVRRGLVFEATPGQPYSLDYGHPSAPAPRYDLARAVPSLAAETIPVATLGPATALPPPARPWTEGRPILIWVTMGLVALVLAGLLFRLARQVRPAAPGGS